MQISLGHLIAKLESCDQEKEVVFDFANFKPGGFDSYRGYYDQLALEYEGSGMVTVAEFLRQCRGAIGHTFTGYKGGEYTMREHTPVWVAGYGEAGHTTLADVFEGDYRVYLKTDVLE